MSPATHGASSVSTTTKREKFTRAASESGAFYNQQSESICQVTSSIECFEVFNKRGFKCSGVVIPDTIVVNPNGQLTDWYFYSSVAPKGVVKNYCDDLERNGAILKKNREAIIDEAVYVALFNNSLLSQFSIEAFETASVAGNHLFKELKNIFTMKVTNEIIKELKFLMPEQSLTDEHKYIDGHLPYLAFVRFWDSDKPGRGFRPFELFELIFFQKLYRVKMLQPFIYARGADLVNPIQSCIVADYRAPSSLHKKVKSADPVVQYWRKAGAKDPTSSLGKKKALG